MESEVLLFKYIDVFKYLVVIVLSFTSGYLVYLGMNSTSERMQHRLRFKSNLQKNKNSILGLAKDSKAEEWFKQAKYPLGLNGIKYYLILYSVTAFLVLYYIVFPVLLGNMDYLAAKAGVILLLIVFALPSNPISLFVYIMKRTIDYQTSKLHSEIFMLYDLIINEIEMMTVHRLNTYSILQNIKPFFYLLQKPLTELLSSWTSDGPSKALEQFSKHLDSKPSEALIGVLQNLDSMKRETALEQLNGMHGTFAKKQVENYRRKRKITTDLLKIPIKATHFIHILNFVLVVVMMVIAILDKSQM